MPKLARRNIANIIDKIGIYRAWLEGKFELAQSSCRDALEGSSQPGNPRKLFRKIGAIIAQPKAVFRCDIASPVGNFDIALKSSGCYNGLRKFVTNCYRLKSSRRDLGSNVRSIGERAPLSCWGRVDSSARWLCVVRDIRIWELDIRFLVLGGVDGGSIGGERISEILLAFLFDSGW